MGSGKHPKPGLGSQLCVQLAVLRESISQIPRAFGSTAKQKQNKEDNECVKSPTEAPNALGRSNSAERGKACPAVARASWKRDFMESRHSLLAEAYLGEPHVPCLVTGPRDRFFWSSNRGAPGELGKVLF